MNGAAQALFSEGFSCSQALFAAHAESLGLSRSMALRTASGLGAGMGRMQETCGAVTGACLVLGLRYGHESVSDKAGKEKTYALVQEFYGRFQAVHGTTKCFDLLGCDLRSETGQEAFRAGDLVNKVCLKCVGTADRIVDELLKETL